MIKVKEIESNKFLVEYNNKTGIIKSFGDGYKLIVDNDEFWPITTLKRACLLFIRRSKI